MNKVLKILVIISIVLIVAGSLLAVIGYGAGGFKSITYGPDGFYVNDIEVDIDFIDINFSDSGRFEKTEYISSDFDYATDAYFLEKENMLIILER